ncbi:DUF1961 family protein [Paenibacillus aceris]|uniref:DUF1961 family protein n=1 Tax=Paenibacillus aceris TaxID=869555 RepID=A0ABS4HXF5_9BACL|nr:DUF1961 family protein [Paenibacillus aceris]MBP1963344.1 hypothetical protein [Paenibacillus aceris]NHW36149.1 DUF1961 family protein [Paenibacillus aceris]
MVWNEIFSLEELIYHNPLAEENDVRDFKMEGQAAASFPRNRMRLENKLDPSLGQASNFVYWCPVEFPDNIAITWDFWPIYEPGLCILFFAARGIHGEDLFDSRLSARTGMYDQYHHGDINAFHVSYFRRKYEEERSFHTCNLRKSYGFHLVSQGGDPIPSVVDARGPYRMKLLKWGNEILFAINEMTVFHWIDDGKTFGKLLGGGKIGFRQMAPLIAEYANLKVYAISKIKGKNS